MWARRGERGTLVVKLALAKVHDGGHLDSRAHGLETSSVISRFLQVAPHPPTLVMEYSKLPRGVLEAPPHEVPSGETATVARRCFRPKTETLFSRG